MDVRFVIGRAGSGKTSLLRDLLVRYRQSDPLWARVIYLVPKQATFMTQRALALDPRLNGFIGVRVAAPDDLAETALVETGSAAGALLDPVGRSLIIGHLLRRHEADLPHFGRSARTAGLPAQIDQAFSEFERAGRDLTEIDTLIDQQPEASPLTRKLTDLKFLYQKYDAYLKERGFDPYRRQMLAPDAIADWPEAQRALVLVDEFYDFTAYERQIVAALAKASAACRIALTIDPASPIARDANLLPLDMAMLNRTERAYRQMHFTLLKSEAAVLPPVILGEPVGFVAPALQVIERSLDPAPPSPVAADGAVKFVLAADPHDEVDAAAREIQSLLKAGLRLRDIAVLARSTGSLVDPIASSFAAHGIPFFIDRRRPAEHHPLLRTLTAITQIIITRWGHESVFEFGKAGLIRFAQDDTAALPIDLLEDYVRQHRIPATEWQKESPWGYRRRSEDLGETRAAFTEDEVAQVNRTRATLRDGLRNVGAAAWLEDKPVQDRIADLVTVMDQLHLQPSVLRLIQQAVAGGDEEKAQEHEQAWNAVREVLDRFVELLGNVAIGGVEFAQLLQSTLAGLDFAIAPPTLDQVLVGSIDRTRVGSVKAVILLGMNECQFPRCELERAILNDADRYHLQRGGYEIEPPTRDALLGERFLGYLALTRASHRLTLIRVERDDAGNAMAPSLFWTAAQRVIDDAPIARPAEPIERVATAAQAVTLTLRAARQGSLIHENGDVAALYNWLTTRPTDRVSEVLHAAWPSLAYRNFAELSPAIAARLFASPLQSSVSRFESFAACPFQHFARYGLRLRASQQFAVTALDLGNLYHAVVEQVVNAAIEKKASFVDPGYLSVAAIRQIAQRVSEDLADQVFLTSAQNRFAVEQLEQCVLKSLQAQQAVLSRGDFRPGYAELTFGSKASRLGPLELKTPQGHVVKLRGKIDRVDLDPDRRLFVVVDYKLGGEALDCGYVAHGLMLQLLTYLLVLRQSGHLLENQPLTPVAAMYVKLLRGHKAVDNPLDAPPPDDEKFHLKNKPRGVIHREYYERFDSQYDGGASDVFSYRVNKDGNFAAAGNDGMTAEQFNVLIDFVQRRITELADEIIGGKVEVSPYLIGKETPCQRCDLQQICRFERSTNGYRRLPAHSRQEALDLISQVTVNGR